MGTFNHMRVLAVQPGLCHSPNLGPMWNRRLKRISSLTWADLSRLYDIAGHVTAGIHGELVIGAG